MSFDFCRVSRKESARTDHTSRRRATRFAGKKCPLEAHNSGMRHRPTRDPHPPGDALSAGPVSTVTGCGGLGGPLYNRPPGDWYGAAAESRSRVTEVALRPKGLATEVRVSCPTVRGDISDGETLERLHDLRDHPPGHPGLPLGHASNRLDQEGSQQASV